MTNALVSRAVLPLIFAFALVGALVFGGQEEVEITVHEVAGTVSYIEGQGGNIGLCVGPDGVLLIDGQFAHLAPKIEQAIAGLTEEKPSFLVNTHWHGDHVGGNEYFSKYALILAHDNVRRRMAGDERMSGKVDQDTPAAALPVLTYDDGATIHFNGERIRLLHYPSSHTDGDTVVWFIESNVVHLGDLFFNVGYPFIDLDSGGDVRGLVRSLNHLLTIIPKDAKLIAGHGEPSDVEGLKVYLSMLEDVVSRVKLALRQGQDAEQMIADGLTSDYDDRWGQFDFVTPAKFIETVHSSLTAERR